MDRTFKFKCGRCEEEHVGIPDLAIDAPLPWSERSEEERAGGRLTADVCEIEDERYVRAMIEIPVLGSDEPFAYGVWVSLGAESYTRYEELGGHGEDTFFGWLSVRLPFYPNTFGLKTRVHLREAPLRPVLHLEPTNHPLALEQRLGIRRARLYEIIENGIHPERVPPDFKSSHIHVACGQEHGEAHGCFVCIHLAEDTGEGFLCGDDPDDPWPDAMCEACAAMIDQVGAWTDEVAAQVQMKIICHHCYEEARAKRAVTLH